VQALLDYSLFHGAHNAFRFPPCHEPEHSFNKRGGAPSHFVQLDLLFLLPSLYWDLSVWALRYRRSLFFFSHLFPSPPHPPPPVPPPPFPSPLSVGCRASFANRKLKAAKLSPTVSPKLIRKALPRTFPWRRDWCPPFFFFFHPVNDFHRGKLQKRMP